MKKIKKVLGTTALCTALLGVGTGCSLNFDPTTSSEKDDPVVVCTQTDLDALNQRLSEKQTELDSVNALLTEANNNVSAKQSDIDELKAERDNLLSEIQSLRQQLLDSGAQVWVNNNSSNEVFIDELSEYLNNITFNGSNKVAHPMLEIPGSGFRRYLLTDAPLFDSGMYGNSAESVYFLEVYVKNSLEASFENGILDYNNPIFYLNDFSYSYVGNKNYIYTGYQPTSLEVFLTDSDGNGYAGTNFYFDSSDKVDLTEFLNLNRFVDGHKIQLTFGGTATLNTPDGSGSYYGDMTISLIIDVNNAPTESELPSA